MAAFQPQHTRKGWKNAAAAAVVMCAVWTVAPAFAAGNAPAGPWSVGPIRGESSSGLGYCSMKNTYADGIMLVFARDAAGANSLALDFAAPEMTAGAQYVVTLEVGSLSRQLVAIAATKDVLLIQIGHDQPFYDMLRRKNVLQVSYQKKSFSFGLDGSADAIEALGACAADLAGGKEVQQVEVSLKPQPAGEDKDELAPAHEDLGIGRQALDSSLKSEIERLRLENRKLQLENQVITRQIAAENAENAALAEAMMEKKKLEAENKKLQKTLKDKKDVVSETAPVAPPAPAKAKKATGDSFMIRLLRAGRVPAQLSGMSGKAQVYTWNAGTVAGGAVEEPRAGKSIGEAIGEYITRAERGCQGDFAHKLGDARKAGSAETITGEIACMDGQSDTASALLFVAQDDNVSAIIFDTSTATVEDALAQRNALAAHIDAVANDTP